MRCRATWSPVGPGVVPRGPFEGRRGPRLNPLLSFHAPFLSLGVVLMDGTDMVYCHLAPGTRLLLRPCLAGRLEGPSLRGLLWTERREKRKHLREKNLFLLIYYYNNAQSGRGGVYDIISGYLRNRGTEFTFAFHAAPMCSRVRCTEV